MHVKNWILILLITITLIQSNNFSSVLSEETSLQLKNDTSQDPINKIQSISGIKPLSEINMLYSSKERSNHIIRPNEILQINNKSNTELEIKAEESYEDILKYGSSFYNKMKNYGNGNIGLNYSQQFNSITLINQTAKFTTEFVLPSNLFLSGNEIVTVNASVNKWMNSTSDYSLNRIDIRFNSFTIYLLLDYSNSYWDSLMNSSENIYLTSHTGFYYFNISSIILNHNLIYPNLLTEISWIAFSTNSYEYNLILSAFKIEAQTKTSSFFVNDQIIENNTAKFYLNISLAIRSNNYTSTHFKFLFETKMIHKLQVNTLLDKENVILLNSTILSKLFEPNKEYTIYFPNSFEDLNIKFSNGSSISEPNNITIYEPISFVIYGKINPTDKSPELIIGEIFQNDNLSIDIQDEKPIFSILVKENDFLVPIFENNTINYSIPGNWSKGSILILILTNDLNYYLIKDHLNYSPLKLVGENDLIIDPLFSFKYNYLIYNASSGNEVTTTKVETYYANGSLRSIENNQQITIFSNEFPLGNESITLKIFADGFANLRYILRFKIIKPILNLDIKSNRKSLTNATISINTNSLYFASTDKIMIFQDSQQIYYNGNIRNQIINIEIQNADWINETLEFLLTIKIASINSSYLFSVFIDPFYSHQIISLPSTSSNTFGIIMSSFVIFVLSTAILKKYKQKRITYITF